MTRRSFGVVTPTAVALLLLLCVPTTARAATISLGWLTFDQFIPADPLDPTSIGTNAFNISNTTGIFAWLPENPLTSVTLLNSSLALTDDSGGSPVSVALGAIDPGVLDDGSGHPFVDLQFPDTRMFASAVFTATLSTSMFLLADGNTFEATSTAVLATLATPGGTLVPNGLSATFTGVELLVSGDVVPPSTTPVPEPSTMLLLGSGLAAAMRSARRRRRE